MECDSIMDISIALNIDDISALNEVSMQLEDSSTAATPAPETWTRSITENKVQNNVLENLQKSLMSIPNAKMISERKKKTLAGISEKQKALEAEVVNTEMKLESQKKVLAEEISKLQTAKEETKCIESKLANVQGRIKSLTKELEDMKHQTSSSDKENISDKSRVDLYRQLTGVTFAGNNPNCPNELKGFAAGVGPTTNLKTFTFNTAEHSSSLMGGYIWNVLEDMHKKNWENLEK